MTVPENSRTRPTHPQNERAAGERTEDGLLDRLRADAATRVLVVHGDAAPLMTAESLMFVSPHDVPPGAQWAFLGRPVGGDAVVAAVFPRSAPEPFPSPGQWEALRSVGSQLPATEADLFVEAVSLGRWLLDAPFCSACGARTEDRQAGWARHCPACGRDHFPRTDPAVIVAITNAGDRDRLLLGSNVLWDANRYSCFAGFVEAGESLESAVRREVREEAGVELSGIRYLGSQAWPYPRSLMLGFHAVADDETAARADGDEIADVRWFDRDQIAEALDGRGDLVLPGPASISRSLIVDWLAAGRS